ncbi:MAG TPA: hypothetical protein VHB02_18490 [Acidimicrobiales bacterium]|nr:hypothetical protein [Acidimicrobiales bacterium]
MATLPADTLFHLAAIAKHYDRREFKDPQLAAEELAEMLSKGQRPALGWYRRHLAPRERPPTYQPPERPSSPGLGD